jgi:alpha-tubulin suppressor-like RCC1 family protein
MKALPIAIAFSVLGLAACTDQEPTLPTITAAAAANTGDVTVTSANPSNAPQDTTLDVHVFGSGFDRGSKAQWAQSGVVSPNVNTNSTKYVSSSELVGNITIALIASTGSYDILVTTSKGKKGIGSELFTISGRAVVSVTVSPTSVTMAVGTTLGLTATTLDVAKKVLTGRAVTWTTSDATVATVSQAGVVNGVAPGSASITATSEGKSATAVITTTPIPAGPLVFATLNVGSEHTCGLLAGGAAYCWGYNDYGNLGNGSSTGSATPLPGAVLGGLSFTSLFPGYWATCGFATSGSLYCWGQNATGLFGDGTGTNSLTPVPAASGLTLTVIGQSDQHICGLALSGAAFCWGWNHYGQLGNGSTTNSSLPIAVSGGLTFTAINLATGLADHACGIANSGNAYCWGMNGSGQVGAATSDICTMPLSRKNTVACALNPVAVSGGLTFTTISVGTHTCGLTGTGALYCWGGNSHGQLGDGTTTNRSTPVPVSGGLTFAMVRTGAMDSCGLTVSGVAYCWGNNVYGQLGDGTNTDRATPTPVAGGLTFVSVQTGAFHTCGLTGGGIVYCWGDNRYGQLGNGATARSYTPVKVAGQP